MGDFNAKVGGDIAEILPNEVGIYAYGQCNHRGQMLLQLCAIYNLTVCNTICSSIKIAGGRHGYLRMVIQWHRCNVLDFQRSDKRSYREYRGGCEKVQYTRIATGLGEEIPDKKRSKSEYALKQSRLWSEGKLSVEMSKDKCID